MSDSTSDRVQLKTCSNPVCKRELPATTEYFFSKSAGSTQLRSRCKQCCSKRNSTWYQEHKEEQDERNKKWREYHLEQARSIGRKYYWNKRESRIAASRKYAASEHGKRIHIAKSIRYHTEKYNLPIQFTAKDWKHCLDYWGGCCAYCGNSSGLWNIIAADHFIPLKSPDCPGTIPTNILPACHSRKDGEGGCNNTKSKRDPEQWLIAKFGEKQAKKILKRIQDYFDSLRE